MDVFFLCRLRADKTVFQFLDYSTYSPVFIDWLPPKENELLPNYALRLKEKFLPDNAIIVGLSFGGMLATEIAKQFSSVKAILISSSKTKSELPSIYRTGKYLPFHHWSPYAFQKWFMLQIKPWFGISSERTKKIYEEIIRNSDPSFNRWAVDAILDWKNIEVPKNLVHIHGTNDRIIPYKYVACDYTVRGGGHLMIMEQAAILSELIKNIIANRPVNVSKLSSSANQSASLFRV